MDLKTFISAVFMLTLVMDPLGNIPLFISALKEVPAERKRAVLARELECDEIEVHLTSGEILNHTSKKRFKFETFPQEMQEIIQAGGLMNFVKKKMSVV